MPDSEENPTEQDSVSVPEEPRGLSALWKTEDCWAVWLGVAIILTGLIVFLPNPPAGMQETFDRENARIETEKKAAPFKTVEWFEALDAKKKLKGTNEPHGKSLKKWTSKPQSWVGNPLDALWMDEERARERAQGKEADLAKAKTLTGDAKAQAMKAQEAAGTADYEDEALNAHATAAIAAWRDAKVEEKEPKKAAGIKAHTRVVHLLGLGVVLAILFSIGMAAMGKGVLRFLLGFPLVFLLALLAYLLAGQVDIKSWGIGYAAWAILFGLIISNTIGTPKWVMPAVQTEYYIKTGLVLLGAEILFGKILAIGLPGIFVSWVVTPIVLVTTFIFGQKVLKIGSKTLNITISADMSVCGVSAAIATGAACRAKKEELTLAVGLSLVFTSIMMILMPMAIKALGIPEVLGGAWMGGTIDATGAVAAAGAFLGDKALNVAATVKMIQNVLIGVIAFCVALYWCTRVERQQGRTVGVGEIWRRFPKFVLGFIGASIVFSLIYETLGGDAGHTLIDQGVIKGLTKNLRGWFFCLAFVSIGLATNFRELRDHLKGGKPLILYVCGQTFNLILTLTMAYIMFYLVFPEITAKI